MKEYPSLSFLGSKMTYGVQRKLNCMHGDEGKGRQPLTVMHLKLTGRRAEEPSKNQRRARTPALKPVRSSSHYTTHPDAFLGMWAWDWGTFEKKTNGPDRKGGHWLWLNIHPKDNELKLNETCNLRDTDLALIKRWFVSLSFLPSQMQLESKISYRNKEWSNLYTFKCTGYKIGPYYI